jgi:post-segregation antitoxin (ccd killing protein)
MKSDYKLICDIEPTDIQLHLLMIDVKKDVINRAKKAEKNFSKLLQSLIKQAKNRKAIIK